MTTRRLQTILSGKSICKGAISKLGKLASRRICGSRSKLNYKMKFFKACKLRLTRLVKLKNGIINSSLTTKN